MYEKRFCGKVDLFGPSLGANEAIIPYACSFDFDLKLLKKRKEKENQKKSAGPHLH